MQVPYHFRFTRYPKNIKKYTSAKQQRNFDRPQPKVNVSTSYISANDLFQSLNYIYDLSLAYFQRDMRLVARASHRSKELNYNVTLTHIVKSKGVSRLFKPASFSTGSEVIRLLSVAFQAAAAYALHKNYQF